MTSYAGIDLHSSNCYLAVIDRQQRRLFSKRLSVNQIKQLTPADAAALFSDTQLGLTARFQVETIGFLTQQIRSIEKAVLPQVKLRPEFEILSTIPGIGKILASTIMLEVGDIRRFAKAGNFASYCRCVKSQALIGSGGIRFKRNEGSANFSFNWEGGLSELRNEYSAVELQHKAAEWR